MKFLVTGTSAYGPQTDESDLDIVVNHETAVAIEEELNSCGIKIYRTDEQQKYKEITGNSGFYFTLGGIDFNIINCGNAKHIMDEWIRATEEMKLLRPIANRKERLEKFHLIAQWPIGDDHNR